MNNIDYSKNPFWSLTPHYLLKELNSSLTGLTTFAAESIREEVGSNILETSKKKSDIGFSKQTNYVFAASLSVALLVLLLPYLPLAALFGFTPRPFKFYIAMLGILALYIGSAEWMKKWFYKKI